MLVSLEVGKVDAGVAVLLTEDKRLIEFPSILLPPDISSGSIVDVNVSRNHDAEARNAKAFNKLQADILSTFGSESPSAPVLRCRNATQTSVVLEWDPIVLATANLRSLSLFRNGTKAGAIPRPFEMTSTKISGLAVDTEYTFSLVLRTSAGTYSSEKLRVRTHKMTDLSGITVTPGIMAQQLRNGLEKTVEKIGAKLIDQVRIDTTHFVCTEGRGTAWEKAREMNIPIVTPDWVIGCEREGRLVSVRGYYLNADPRQRTVGSGMAAQQQQQPQQHSGSAQDSQQDLRSPVTPRTEVTPPTPEQRNTTNSSRTAMRQEEQESSDEDEDESEHAVNVTAAADEKARDEEGEDDDEEEDEEGSQEIESSNDTTRDEWEGSKKESVRSSKTSTTTGAETPSGGDNATAETFDDVDL